ncbi:MAG: DegT/DnrJ/EryC1/StrS family aminotransferase [Actinomyces sp.]|nr:MAG: DegT/DnrJ/EryC1/StrS family aminotransferase [Actinomyces sp.]
MNDTPSPPVKLVDLTRIHEPLADEVLAGIARLVDTNAFIGGRAVAEFEEAWALWCGTQFAVGVANGTDAIEIALRALDLEPGAEVVLPANTFIATAEAVVRAGLTPVFCDVEPRSLLATRETMAACVTDRTAALLPVHLYGALCPVVEIRALADEHGLRMVEDAAQAHGARRGGIGAGALGDAASFSFYPGKNLGAMGDAGAVVTNSAEIDRAARLLRNHGARDEYVHETFGFNSRMDAFQACALSAKLPHLGEWNEQRRAAVTVYREALGDIEGLNLLEYGSDEDPVWHLFPVRLPFRDPQRRDEVRRRLAERGVETKVHYAVPVHLTPAFAAWGSGAGQCPVAEDASERMVSLPLFPGITGAEQERVVDALRSALAEVGS